MMDEKQLDYKTARRAVRGEHEAQMKVLEYYDRRNCYGYIFKCK